MLLFDNKRRTSNKNLWAILETQSTMLYFLCVQINSWHRCCQGKFHHASRFTIKETRNKNQIIVIWIRSKNEIQKLPSGKHGRVIRYAYPFQRAPGKVSFATRPTVVLSIVASGLSPISNSRKLCFFLAWGRNLLLTNFLLLPSLEQRSWSIQARIVERQLFT